MARQRIKKADLEKLKAQKPALGHSPSRASQTFENKRAYSRKRDKKAVLEE
ncbi:MAG: hypothetical protein ACK41E_11520 [Deinococcales bacterium]